MCGIAGIFHYGRPEPVSRAQLEDMNARLVHRGPDEGGVHVAGRIGLAMRRLSIIDLAQGQQPMANEDGTIWIVFNGEIYNYLELRSKLQAKGHPFKTMSDTEVLLHLYEEMGEQCVRKLRGMFAFAIWDDRKQKLFLARDRFGKKPLVYHHHDGRFCWASEIGALTALPWVSREIDDQAVELYLGLQYIPSPRTIYSSVRKLPPAHTLTLENGRVQLQRYWQLPEDGAATTNDVEEAKDLIRKKLEESTRLRMISDVPLGAFLSGGFDSSVIVGIMSGLSARPVKTFSIGFEEQDMSELPHAREVAKHFGTEHTEFIVKPDMVDVLPKLAAHYGEPFGDCSALPSYYLARETRRHVTVALNGDGGDENFGGYQRYVPMKAFRKIEGLPRPLLNLAQSLGRVVPHRKIRRAMEHLNADVITRYQGLIGIFTGDEPAAAAARRYLGDIWNGFSSNDFVNRLLHLDFNSYLPECLMTKIDIATMANSLEGRSPLLDHEFVEMTFRMKGEWKLNGLKQSKWIFKQAFKSLLPASITDRSKMGFGIPVHAWFRGPLKKMWKDRVLAPEAMARGHFQPGALERLFEEHISGRRDHGYRMWNLLMLEMWNGARV